jgi:shikimate 5-dehydrogenase
LTAKKREGIGVEMEQNAKGVQVSLPVKESKHYFNATVVSNACAIGVVNGVERGIGKGDGKQRPKGCK